MEYNIIKIIYVYDRLNRKIHECKITELKGGWVYYNFNGKDCAYWLNGSKVASENVCFKPNNYKFLVSMDYKSLCEIQESDKEIYSIFNRALKEQCDKMFK